MKILQVAPHFLPYMGGQEIYIYNLSKYLVKNGHEVHIITSNYPKSKYFEEIDGITIERNNLIARPLRNPISLGFLKIKKLSNEFDIIQIHNLYAFSSLLATYYKNNINCPIVFADHGKLEFGNQYKDFFVKMYSKTIAKQMLNKIDSIIALSKSQRDYLSSLSPEVLDKVNIIPNAIDISLFKELDRKIGKTNEEESFNFLYIGQIIKRKGITWLIKAFKRAIKTNKNIKLTLVGDGENLNYFRNLVNNSNLSDYIEFKGRIDNKSDLIRIYKNSDGFILPSLSEGLPTVILEALYFGLPVISTDIGGIKEHFENYISLVPPRDSTSLAESIIDLSKGNNFKEAKKNSSRFKEVIKRKYSWNAVADKYETIYENILNDQIFN